VQESGHSQEVEKTEEEGRKVACGFGEIGETCDFTSFRKRGKGLAEFEVAGRANAIFSNRIGGCTEDGSTLVSGLRERINHAAHMI
jgi:hypothetical protein